MAESSRQFVRAISTSLPTRSLIAGTSDRSGRYLRRRNQGAHSYLRFTPMSGMLGTFHKVSKKYLPLYVAEFQFRYNNRRNADIYGTAFSGC